jgi:hypothetical protein
MWEPAVLAINREGYGIKCNGQRGVVCTENFLQARAVCPYSLVVFFPESGSKYFLYSKLYDVLVGYFSLLKRLTI